MYSKAIQKRFSVDKQRERERDRDREIDRQREWRAMKRKRRD